MALNTTVTDYDESAVGEIAAALRIAVLSFLSTSEARNVAAAAQRELNPPPSSRPTGSLEDFVSSHDHYH